MNIYSHAALSIQFVTVIMYSIDMHCVKGLRTGLLAQYTFCRTNSRNTNVVLYLYCFVWLYDFQTI